MNDTFGHAAGDGFLRQVTQRLRGCLPDQFAPDGTLPEHSRGLLARIGADEFAVLLPRIDGQDGAHAVARRIVAHLARSFDVEGQEIFVSAAVGIAVFQGFLVSRPLPEDEFEAFLQARQVRQSA